MTRLRTPLLAATILGVPGAVLAQPIQGLYIGAGAGGNYLQQERVLASPGLNLGPKRLATDIGGVGVGSVGYGFGNGFRVEIEGDVRHNRIRQLNGFVNGSGPTASGGDQFSYGAMANVLFDMDIGQNWLYPYFGLGAAGSPTAYLDRRCAPTAPAPRAGLPIRCRRERLVGPTSPTRASSVCPSPSRRSPGLSLTAEYRFYGVLDGPSFHGLRQPVGGHAPAWRRPCRQLQPEQRLQSQRPARRALRLQHRRRRRSSSRRAARRSRLSTPARTYLVFFDWDRSDLTDRARQIVAEAAQASTRVQTTRIEVQGNADRSGTPAYNQRLSLRRAQTVAAELVRDGVPRTAIDIQAFGRHPSPGADRGRRAGAAEPSRGDHPALSGRWSMLAWSEGRAGRRPAPNIDLR